MDVKFQKKMEEKTETYSFLVLFETQNPITNAHSLYFKTVGFGACLFMNRYIS